MNEDIPRTWLNSATSDVGWLPTVGVGRRGARIVLRPSRSIYVLSMLLLATGIVLCAVNVGPFWVIGPPLILGAIAAPVGAPLFHQYFGTGLEVDLLERTVTVTRRNNKRIVPFDRIVAMQQLNSTRRGSGQFNLVFLDEDGAVDRTCLYAHAIGYYTRRMARDFARHVPWPVVGPDGRQVG